MRKIKEYFAVFAIGGCGYTLLEILWRGHTHWSMTLTGGVCFCFVYNVNHKFAKSSIFKRCAVCSLIITAVEFFVGVLVNLVLRLNVWSYASRPGNILGQVCPLYSVLWFILCIPLAPLCKALKNKFTPLIKIHS